MCRQGASAIQTDVLDQIDDSSLRAFVAWVPILPDDRGPPDTETLALVHDRRASHFWDEGKLLSEPFARVLGLPDGWPAWDVYLAYPAGVRWNDAPPAPAFWHHQLGDEPDAPKLDGPAFRTQLQAMLAAK